MPGLAGSRTKHVPQLEREKEGRADQSGQDLAWSLGTIQGLDRASVTFTVTLPSTIPMQLARAVFLTPEVTLERKIREILLAMEIEKRFTKNEIPRGKRNDRSRGGVSACSSSGSVHSTA